MEEDDNASGSILTCGLFVMNTIMRFTVLQL